MANTNLAPDLVVYEHAHLYDVAFSYRDFDAEASAMMAWATALRGTAPTSALELCAGPADHAIVLAKRGVAATALDLSDAMCTYAQDKAKAHGATINVVAADMREFGLPSKVELAFTMLNSISHLHAFDDVVQHMKTMSRVLTDDGVYVLEVQHPRDFVGRGGRPTGVSATWTASVGDTTVVTTWGSADGPYDHIGQVFSAHVLLKATVAGKTVEHREVVRMRDWTRDELRAAATLGGLTLRQSHGDFDNVTPLDNSDAAWRMLLVFQRTL